MTGWDPSTPLSNGRSGHRSSSELARSITMLFVPLAVPAPRSFQRRSTSRVVGLESCIMFIFKCSPQDKRSVIVVECMYISQLPILAIAPKLVE